MPITDYAECKIYKLVSSQTDKIYIGSSCQKQLSKRLGQHKTDYKKYLNGKNRYMSSFEIVKYPDAKIILVQAYPNCKNSMERCMFEQGHIDIVDCVNKLRAYTSPELAKEHNKERKKEYYEENKDQILENSKKYNDAHKEEIAIYYKEHYENNKEKILEYHKEYYDTHKEESAIRYKKRYDENKEKILEYAREKVICVCGAELTRGSLSKHKTSKIHQTNLNNLSQKT